MYHNAMFLYATPMVTSFDDAAPAPEAPKGLDSLSPEQKAEVDKLLKQHTESAKRAMTELDALKARTDLTAGQRKDLETRFEAIQKELMTKEELFEQEKKKKESKHATELTNLTQERDSWKSRFTESNIIRAITDASSQHKAYDNDTIVAMLRPNATLIESLDAEGKPTGSFETKIKFLDPEGKDGKVTDFVLTASEAVKRMTELSKFGFLFQGTGTGGLGMNNSANGKNVDMAKLASDPVAYREARKKNRQ